MKANKLLQGQVSRNRRRIMCSNENIKIKVTLAGIDLRRIIRLTIIRLTIIVSSIKIIQDFKNGAIIVRITN